MVMKKILRFFKHAMSYPGLVRRYISAEALAKIQSAIATAEANHRGEIRFVIEAGLQPMQILRGVSARQRALDLFSRLRVWDTEQNSGVLIYILFADRAVEIVADRGVNQFSNGGQKWVDIVRAMENDFSSNRFEEGAITGVNAVAALLQQHFPLTDSNPNELPNEVTLL